MRRSFPLLRLPRASFGAWLLLIGVVATVPMLAFSLLALQRLVRAAHDQEIEALHRRAAIAADTVDRELDRVRALTKVLALSDAAATGDLQALHAQAVRVLATEPGLQVFSLVRADGQRLLSTSRPWGAVSESRALTRLEHQAMAEDRALVTPLVPAGPTGGVVVVVLQPLPRPGGEPWLLRAAVRQSVLHEALVSLRWPPTWTVSLIDQRMNIIARSRDEARFLGQAVTPDLQAHLRSEDAATFTAANKEGEATLGVIARVPDTDWWVVVGEPLADVEERERAPLRWMVAAGLPLCLIGIALAAWLGRDLRRQVRNVAAGEVGRSGDIPEFRMISERARRTNDALDAARLDGLTGLAARPLFEAQLRRLAVRALDDPDTAIALLFIDLDGFKQVNDRLGHDAGDAVLKDVATVLRRVMRTEDLVARFGGDEFVTALSGPTPALPGIALEVADRLVAEVADLGEGIGCSIGVAVAPAGTDLVTLTHRADQAMLRAKAAGKNRVVLDDDPDGDAAAQNRK